MDFYTITSYAALAVFAMYVAYFLLKRILSNPQKRDEMLRNRLQEARSAVEIWEIYEDTPRSSNVKRPAFERFIAESRKQLQEAISFDDVEDVLNLLDNVSALDSLTNLSSSKRLYAEAFRKGLSLARTTDQAEELFDRAEEDSDLQREAAITWIKLARTVDACEDIWDQFGTDSEMGEMAIRRAAEIIGPPH